MSTLTLIIATTLILSGGVIGTSYVVFLKILTKYRRITSDVTIQELLVILNSVIQTELDLFDQDVFSTKGALTNTNFENYYHEISTHIISSLSPVFFDNMSKYMNEEAVITLIGRRVKAYLVTKVHGAI